MLCPGVNVPAPKSLFSSKPSVLLQWCTNSSDAFGAQAQLGSHLIAARTGAALVLAVHPPLLHRSKERGLPAHYQPEPNRSTDHILSLFVFVFALRASSWRVCSGVVSSIIFGQCAA
jgi:hypothetical protein